MCTSNCSNPPSFSSHTQETYNDVVVEISLCHSTMVSNCCFKCICCYACFTDEERELFWKVECFPQSHIPHKDRPRTESELFRLSFYCFFFLFIKKRDDYVDQSTWNVTCTGWYQIFSSYLTATLASLQASFNPWYTANHAWDISHQEDCQMWEKSFLVVRRHRA